MNKFFIYFGITVGGLIGAYIPVVLFNADALSLWSILLSAAGSFAGLWAGFKLSEAIGE